MFDTKTRFSGQRAAPADSQVVIDGSYSSSDAKDLVRAVLDAVRDVHKLRNLRSHVQTQSADGEALDAIDELAAVRTELEAALARSRSSGSRVRLSATIRLEVDGDALYL